VRPSPDDMGAGMDRSVADIVVGLGAMGAATLWQLAARGADVIGIDMFGPPHEMGSSHGETRITRQAVGEGEALVPLALRSNEIWQAIEAETGARLLTRNGCLLISDPDDRVERPGRTGFLARTRAAAARFGIAHEVLDAAEIRHRHPQFAVGDGDVAYFEPGGGYLRPEACVEAQLQLAARAGAQLRLGTRVQGLRPDPGGRQVEVITDAGTVVAGQVVVSAGARAAALLGPATGRWLKPTRQMLHWFAVDPDALAMWQGGPVFIWPHGTGATDFFYGFPAIGGTVKTATENYAGTVDPDAMGRTVTPADHARMFETHMATRLRGVGPGAVRGRVCLYTQTPDSGFVIDTHPEHPGITVVSPCSGHGFKHSAAIGEAVSQRLLDGASRIDLSAFTLARFGA